MNAAHATVQCACARRHSFPVSSQPAPGRLQRTGGEVAEVRMCSALRAVFEKPSMRTFARCRTGGEDIRMGLKEGSSRGRRPFRHSAATSADPRHRKPATRILARRTERAIPARRANTHGHIGGMSTRRSALTPAQRPRSTVSRFAISSSVKSRHAVHLARRVQPAAKRCPSRCGPRRSDRDTANRRIAGNIGPPALGGPSVRTGARLVLRA